MFFTTVSGSSIGYRFYFAGGAGHVSSAVFHALEPFGLNPVVAVFFETMLAGSGLPAHSLSIFAAPVKYRQFEKYGGSWCFIYP